MMKKLLRLGVLLLIVLLLTGCGKKETPAPVVPTLPGLPATQAPIMEQMATEIPLPQFDVNLPENYDPASEEDPSSVVVPNIRTDNYNASAGATPIPIDPVDLPTPTPRPPLVFSYAKYTANALGISFESVANYEIDESQPGAYTLREPLSMLKDNYPVQITFTMTPVQSGYKADTIKADLRDKFKSISSVNFTSWETTSISRRTLLGKEGYYGNYRGVMFDGTIVRGRVHMALVDGQLLTIHISYPGWYNTDYLNVFGHIRDTLKKL